MSRCSGPYRNKLASYFRRLGTYISDNVVFLGTPALSSIIGPASNSLKRAVPLMEGATTTVGALLITILSA